MRSSNLQACRARLHGGRQGSFGREHQSLSINYRTREAEIQNTFARRVADERACESHGDAQRVTEKSEKSFEFPDWVLICCTSFVQNYIGSTRMATEPPDATHIVSLTAGRGMVD